MKTLLSTAVLALLVLGSAAQAQDKKPVAFGALESLSASETRARAAAWLKEVGRGDASTTAKLDAIWKDQQRSILDRLADSLALGDATAAKLMADARNPLAPAPIVLPEVFKNEKASKFFRANFALVYARALTNRRVYEEALDTLKQFGPEQVADPASYLFHRAVCEHALQQKSEAIRSIQRLIEESGASAPDRYKIVATLMRIDMHTWKDKDLGDIARKMDNIERRLEIARGGPETRRQQREVLNRLDEMIKKLENQNKKKSGDGPPKPGDGPPMPGNGDECPDGSKPGDGSGPPKGVNPPTSPATKEGDANPPTTGEVDKKKFKTLVENWGRLPPREQQRALQDLTNGMSARHRDAIEAYFRSLTNPAFKR